MKPGFKIIFFATLLFIFILQDQTQAATINRIEGKTRYDTAVEISKQTYPNGTNVVVLVTGEDFPDALAGSPLAFKFDAPILSTRKSRLPDVTRNEITRLGATEIIILGGTGAISSNVEDELKKLNVTISRIAGKNRYETAALIANQIGSEKAIVANGQNFPDALTVAPYAAKEQIPILLTRDRVLPAETKNQLRNETIVLGGEKAISSKIASTLPNVTRLSGATRYETNIKIVDFFDKSVGQAFVTTGMNFADALTGSILAAKNQDPILLVRPDYVPIKSQLFLKLLNPDTFNIIGGQAAITPNAANSLSQINDLHAFVPSTNSQFHDENYLAGVLQKNQMYLANSIQNNKYGFHYGYSNGVIDISKTKARYTVDDIIRSNLSTDTNSNKTILITKNVPVIDSDNVVVATIYAGQRIPLVSENKSSFIVNIGGRKGYISKNSAVVDNGVPILMYHHILRDQENKNYRNVSTTISDIEFKEQMAFLQKNGYKTITLEDLELFLTGKKNLPAKAVVITFDDGLKSVYRYAYPTLKQYNMKAAQFVITGRTPSSPTAFNPDSLQYLSWQEMNEMRSVYGYHSHTHALHQLHNKKSLLIVKSKNAIINDLRTSKRILDDTPYFAYPYGHYTGETISYLKETGYRMALTTRKGKVKVGDDLFQLKRIGIGPGTTIKTFESLIKN
ncbi:cell wall-binding repeat-containing protein [Bacillus timonensis]|uniref:cell wall-binding repeat-containing protein n=1 Tax=Bacillus timonensis TaxID=1033734 RepID=UPI000289E0F8|nr:cell wall-binding repeat-containing protein [Bacillus timonensis]